MTAESAIQGRVSSNATPNSQAVIRADVTRYVNRIGSDGWLKVKDASTPNGKFLFLCKYTKVTLLGSKQGRTVFKVVDGTHAGYVVSLSDANAGEHLGKVAPVDGVLTVTVKYGRYVERWPSVARNQMLDQQMASVQAGAVSAQAAMNSVWSREFFPLPAGTYDILVPDFPHDANMTRYYRRTEPKLVHDQVWFPVRFGNNSRFVHVGNVSDGCVTILDLDKWTALHEELVRHRSPDGRCVGKLVVTGEPERAR